MRKPSKPLRAGAITDTALRRMSAAPNYFFLVWRWSMWLYALIIILFFQSPYQERPGILPYHQIAILLLTITFLQTLIITLYAPVFHIVLFRIFPGISYILPRQSARLNTTKQMLPSASELDEEPQGLSPFEKTRYSSWDPAVYALDAIICGLVVYFSGPFTNPPMGVGSPFYRYGMSTGIAAALMYRYRGGLAAAFSFDLFVIAGMVYMAPGAPSTYTPNVIDIAGSLVDAPVAALLAAYLTTLLSRYRESKRSERDQRRQLTTILRVHETLMKGTNEQKELLQRSTRGIQRGGKFGRLVIALVDTDQHENKGHVKTGNEPPAVHIYAEKDGTLASEDFTHDPKELIKQVLQSEQEIMDFETFKDENEVDYGRARLYLRFPKGGTTQIVIGAESRRGQPFTKRHIDFLRIVGSYLLVALDNLRLIEQTNRLAADAERGRISREIHDGIAQLTYMLSLQAETCEAQAQRLSEASEEDAELLTPLIQRLGKMVTISKQALWETRNYMFSLKPLMNGRTTLTTMVTNQLREFEAISDLTTSLEVEGIEEPSNGNEKNAQQYARVGTALFRIIQESLTNAYKHAEATHIHVQLIFESEKIKVTISDNGHGLAKENSSYQLVENSTAERIYSGYGVAGMRERTKELGGSFELLSLPMGGVSVQASIPRQ